MDWQSALLARLRSDEPTTALIGAKSYWEQVPQNSPAIERPYVTLFDVTELRPRTLKGWDVELARVQIDVWTDRYADKQLVTEAVLDALVPAHTTGGHVFQRAEVALGPRDVGGERDGATPIFRKTVDLSIYHTPAD
jgi:hypothetical protein